MFLIRTACLTLALIVTGVTSVQLGLAWGPEGHQVTALIAEQYLTAGAKAQATDLLDGSMIVSVR